MKKILVFLLCLALILNTSGLAMPAFADDSIYGGECGVDGDNVIWTFDSITGNLTISGEGAMIEYTSVSDIPWYTERMNIVSVLMLF